MMQQGEINQSTQLAGPFSSAVSQTANVMLARFKVDTIAHGGQTVNVIRYYIFNNRSGRPFYCHHINDKFRKKLLANICIICCSLKLRYSAAQMDSETGLQARGSLHIISVTNGPYVIIRRHWRIFERSAIKGCDPPSTKIYFILTLPKWLEKKG